MRKRDAQEVPCDNHKNRLKEQIMQKKKDGPQYTEPHERFSNEGHILDDREEEKRVSAI